MKFGITKLELFALTSHLVGQPSPNPEYGVRRIRAWGELGVTDVADALSLSSVGFGEMPKIADWKDNAEKTEIELTLGTVDHIIAGMKAQTASWCTDIITRLRERIESQRDQERKG